MNPGDPVPGPAVWIETALIEWGDSAARPPTVLAAVTADAVTAQVIDHLRTRAQWTPEVAGSGDYGTGRALPGPYSTPHERTQWLDLLGHVASAPTVRIAPVNLTPVLGQHAGDPDTTCPNTTTVAPPLAPSILQPADIPRPQLAAGASPSHSAWGP